MARRPLILSLAAAFALLATADPPCWTRLPHEQEIPLCAGNTYDVLASVSKDFSKADILAKAPACVEVVSFQEQGPGLGPDPNPDHRYVSAKFVVHAEGETLPWKSPFPLTIFHLVSASWTTGAAGSLPHPSPPPKRYWPWLVGGLIGVVALGCFGWWWMHRSAVAR